MRVSSAMDQISCRKRNFYNFVQDQISPGDALPSGTHQWAQSRGNDEWRHSASGLGQVTFPAGLQTQYINTWAWHIEF